MKTLFATLISLTIAVSAFAQNQPSTFQYTVIVSVKPSMNEQFEETFKQAAEAAKKNGAQPWFTFNVSAGGDGDQYGFVVPFDKWADRDNWKSPGTILRETLGEDEAAKLLRNSNLAEVSTTSSVLQFDPMTSSPGASSGIKKRYLVRQAVVKSGMAGDYRLALSKIRAAQDKAGGPYTVTRSTILGERNEFSSSVGYDSGAERDQWPNFGEFMGAMYSEQEIDQILETLNDSMESSTWYEVVYRPELSNAPTSTSSNE